MKITAVFLSKKKHNDSKWLVDKIKAQNKRNENKVTINNFNGFDKKNIKLGYVKLINSKVFYYSKYKPTISVHSIEKNGILKRVFIKIIFK